MFKGLTYSFTILFVILLVVLSFNSRFAADDYYFIFLERTYGAVGGTFFQYNDFSGRWLCHFISLFLLKFSGYKYFLPVFFLFTFGILYLIVSSLFYKIYCWYHIEEKDFNSDFPPLLFMATFILCSFSVGESWFWFISVMTYVWSLIFGLILVNLYLNNKKRFYTPVLLIFSSLYIGSASEAFALVMIFFSILFLIFRIRKEGPENFKINPGNKPLILSMILIFVSFLISTLSPGTFHRNELLPEISLIEKSQVLIRSFGKIIIRYIPSNAHLFLILCLPWMAFGFYIQEVIQSRVKHILKDMLIVIILTGAAVLISILPTVFILGESGPARALLVVTLIITIGLTIFFTLAGMLFRNESAIIKSTTVAIFFALVYLFYQNIHQYRSTGVFARAYDERIDRLTELTEENFRGIAEIPALPSSGMVHHIELSTDSLFYVNQHWKNGLQLKYNVVLAH